MPIAIADKKVFSLLEVTLSIRKTLAERYQRSFWVKAEINKLNYYPYSGHCYPDLVEKREGKVIAQLKSNLWKNDFDRINAKFQSVLQEPIRDGITVLLCAAIGFDSNHGLSLRIIDIDPSFSLGELEREKRQAIEKLKAEGIFGRNKLLPMALLPQRIAVISAESSKGYSDYLKVLDQNPWGYKFFNFLFPAILQGEKSVTTILYQLKRIRKVIEHFDAVAIVRGGGGDIGLSSYNDLELSREIALFPLPIITGIGHSTNETVSEMVSFRNAITPTELADFLLQKFHEVAEPVRRAEESITEFATRHLKDERLSLWNIIRYLHSVTTNGLLRNHTSLTRAIIAFEDRTRRLLVDEKQLVDMLEKQTHMLSPVNVLGRGYTITLSEGGKAISRLAEVKTGSTLTTLVRDGQLTSTVRETKET